MDWNPASLALAASLLLGASSAAAGEPADGVGEPDGPNAGGAAAVPAAASPAAPALMIEAESAAETGADWQADSRVQGSVGQAYLRWGGGTTLQPGDRAVASFVLELPRDGLWQLRLRHSSTPAPGRTSSALWVAVDDEPWRSVALEPSTSWSWATSDPTEPGGGPPLFALTAGRHTLRLAGHTPGVMVDRFVLQSLVEPAIGHGANLALASAATPVRGQTRGEARTDQWSASLVPARNRQAASDARPAPSRVTPHLRAVRRPVASALGGFGPCRLGAEPPAR